MSVLLGNREAVHNIELRNTKRWFAILRFIIIMVFLSLTPLIAHAVSTITDFEEFSSPTYNSLVMFRQPSFTGSTDDMLLSSPDTSQVVQPVGGIGGNTTNILKTSFAWDSFVSAPVWLRFSTYDSPGLPVRPLSNPQVDLSQFLLFDIYSDKSVNLFGVGIRETNTAGPIGSDGGTSGTIEWVSNAPLGAWPNPIAGGVLISPNKWYTIGIDLSDPSYIRGFTGNGILTGTNGFGVLEHLAFTPHNNIMGTSSDPHVIYFDNFRQAASVPEPSTLFLIGSGLSVLGLIYIRRELQLLLKQFNQNR